MSAKLLEAPEEAKVWWAGEGLEVPAGGGVRRAGMALAMPGWPLLNSNPETLPQVNWPDFRMGQSWWRGKNCFKRKLWKRLYSKPAVFFEIRNQGRGESP